MNCCINCFSDSEIIAIIESRHNDGSCDFCGSLNVPIYSIGSDDEIEQLFDGLLDVYTPSASLPISFPKENTDLIKNFLSSKWNIFNLEPKKIYQLIKALCSRRFRESPELFNNPVGILESVDIEYLEKNAILKDCDWPIFTQAIKHDNRFHNDYINKSILELFLRCSIKTYKKETIFYRARISTTRQGYKKDQMGAPPKDLASAGRVNSEGISVLYLSDSQETTLYEVRASVHDYVSVGCFKLLSDIDVISIADIDKISPFIGVQYGFDLTQYAMNIEHLRMISQEIAKPLRRQDSVLDYVPTQYISDFIKSKGFYGIEFHSTMCKHGENFAVFNPDLLSCIKVKTFKVDSVAYSYSVE